MWPNLEIVSTWTATVGFGIDDFPSVFALEKTVPLGADGIPNGCDDWDQPSHVGLRPIGTRCDEHQGSFAGVIKKVLIRVSELSADAVPVDSGIGQIVGLGVALPTEMRNREVQNARQLSAGPVERIEPRAAASINAAHLLYDHFRIGEHVHRFGFELHCTAQGFVQSKVLGDIIVLVSNPL